MKLYRFQKPKKTAYSGYRPNRKGKQPSWGKDGKISNQKGAFGSANLVVEPQRETIGGFNVVEKSTAVL